MVRPRRASAQTVDTAYRLLDITVPGVMELTGGTYDEAGNLIARTEDTGDLALAQFTYDGIDRLDTADGAFGNRDYDLDRNGNRNKVVADGATTTYTYPRNRYRKHDNQPTRDTFWTYTHDANGSITAKTSTVGAPDLGYEYDARNRLIRTTSDDGTVAILGEYAYNGLGQRVSKDAGGEVFEYRYGLGGELLAVIDSAGQPVREFVYLNSQPLAVVDHGADAVYYVHNDHLGTPRALSDETGSRVWTAIYDPFGAATVDEDPDQDGISVTLNLRFPGQYYDQETGLHYNYYRTYDPSTGRYLESDPIGLVAGLNTYSYVGNMPTMYVDPFGLDPFGLDYFKCMLFGGNDPSCRGEIERDIEEKVKNFPDELLDASASLAKDTADDVGACTACVVECTFSAVVGDSPEEIIATASKEVAMQHIDWVAKGTLGNAAAKSLTRRLRIWEAPMQLYDFATCQCKAFD